MTLFLEIDVVRVTVFVSNILIYLLVVTSSIAFLDMSDTFIATAFNGGLIAFTGALDVRCPLKAIYRLALQLMAGETFASMDVSVHNQGNLIGLDDVSLVLLVIRFRAIMSKAFAMPTVWSMIWIAWREAPL